MSSHSVSPDGQLSQEEESDEYHVKIVEEINKPKLGKLIIEYCGNEGSTDDEQAASMRTLLQRAITNLEPQQEQYPGVWRDAELKIFDLYGNGYVVKSGEGSVKFVAQITGNGDVQLSKIKDESWWTSMKALVSRQNGQRHQIEGGPPDKNNASQSWWPSWPFRSSKPEADQTEGLAASGLEHEQSTSESPSQMEPDLESIDRDGATDDHRSVPKDPTPCTQTDPQRGEDESQYGFIAAICNNCVASWVKEHTPHLPQVK
ncbi:Hypp8648 [Branchiostoma lanceolatum]|uniref:Hypp8648 protein n=1 Tax=Branchiostoma lanceolatum TaxID=7740 RepID=A0A8J9Z886_BRALA|nr:Hypp8648 [Branchiostoma lanceolatum]